VYKFLVSKAISVLVCGILLQVLCYILSFSISKEQIFDKRVSELNQKIITTQRKAKSDIRKLKNVAYTPFAFTDVDKKYYQKPYALLFFKNDSLKFWTNRSFKNENIIVRYEPGVTQVMPVGSINYLVDVVELSDSTKAAMALPFHRDFDTKNSIWKTKFPLTPRLQAELFIDPVENSTALVTTDGQKIAYLTDALAGTTRSPRMLVFFWVISMSFMYLGLVLCFLKYKDKIKKIHPILAVWGALYLWRYILMHDAFDILIKSPLFQPDLYANKSLAPSLGVLFITSLMYLNITKLWYDTRLLIPDIEKIGTNARLLKGLYFMIIFSLTPLILVTVLQSILIDSNIYIDFRILDNLNFVSFFATAVVVVALIIFHFFVLRLIRNIKKLNLNTEQWILIIIISLLFSFIVYNLILSNPYNFFTTVWTVFYLMLFLFFLQGKEYLTNFSSTIFLICAYSLLMSYNFDYYQKKKTDIRAEQLAKIIATENDNLLEYLFTESVDGIASDILVKRSFSDPFISEPMAVKRIVNQYLSGYIGNYDAEINFFDEHPEDLKDTISLIEGNYLTKEYLLNIPVSEDQDTIGSIQIYLSQDKVGRSNNEFSLYSSGSSRQFINPESYSVAVSRNGRVRFSRGDYPYTNLNTRMPKNSFRKIQNKKDIVYLYGSRKNEIVSLRVDKSSQLMNFFTIFSYGVCLLIFFTVLFTLFRTRFMFKPSKFFRNSIANRIQFAFLALLFLMSILIALVSTPYVKGDMQKEILREDNRVVNDIIEDYNFTLSQLGPEREVSAESLSSHLQGWVFPGQIINVYDEDGERVYSSDESFFEEGLWPDYLDPRALAEIREKDRNSFFQSEDLGYLDYQGYYRGVQDSLLNLKAVIYLPNFMANTEVNKQVGFFNVTLFNVFTYVLLLATLISLIVTRFLTNVLTKLRKQLSSISIDRDTEPLRWESEDEIGLIVKEYNEMLSQVEESAFLLARTERESAWRDLAKQVAHEIKNPLTPMRLSVQHLKRTYSIEDKEEENSMKLKTMNTLIAQIDHLTQIADDFSSLAKMPLPKNEKMDLQHSIEEILPLFSTQFAFDLKFEDLVTSNNAWVFADPTMINRIINNLVKNAQQALLDDRKGLIDIKLEEQKRHFLLTISDNGRGIPKRNRAKIFTPNFTTKSTGTGIGLMMTQKIIEMASGKIWFDSEVNKGTNFYVRLPKHRDMLFEL